jgi:hypothetical protein
MQIVKAFVSEQLNPDNKLLQIYLSIAGARKINYGILCGKTKKPTKSDKMIPACCPIGDSQCSFLSRRI